MDAFGGRANALWRSGDETFYETIWVVDETREKLRERRDEVREK